MGAVYKALHRRTDLNLGRKAEAEQDFKQAEKLR